MNNDDMRKLYDRAQVDLFEYANLRKAHHEQGKCDLVLCIGPVGFDLLSGRAADQKGYTATLIATAIAEITRLRDERDDARARLEIQRDLTLDGNDAIDQANAQTDEALAKVAQLEAEVARVRIELEAFEEAIDILGPVVLPFDESEGS